MFTQMIDLSITLSKPLRSCEITRIGGSCYSLHFSTIFITSLRNIIACTLALKIYFFINILWRYKCINCNFVYFQVVYKHLYRNSARELGTLRYFREKLQRRNVSLYVKHYEDCEQLFISVGRCYTVEALLDFFAMGNTDCSPSKNGPSNHVVGDNENQKQYFEAILDKFLDENSISPAPTNNPRDNSITDYVKNHSLTLKYFFLISDYKDAVKEGNGQRLHTVHKQLLHHFKANSGFNAYAIEMLTNIVQNEVMLSKREAIQCVWAATANWNGGKAKNIEIDLLQENRNRDLKQLIKNMGANKTDRAIECASKAVGGVRKIVENFERNILVKPISTSHMHKSADGDEKQILADLRKLTPFNAQEGRKHESFPKIDSDPLCGLDDLEFNKWLVRHKKNLLFHAPAEQDDTVEQDKTSDLS